ncbi:MAG: RNA-binding S4 domain-containing protein [Candidatus Binatia bacterium]
MKGIETEAHIRLDKWLWAARFFKTRSLAAEAIEGGKVHVSGERTKAARAVRLGDEISVRRGPYEWVVIVRGLSIRRGPASEAQLLYEETGESKQRREALTEQLRAQGAYQPSFKGRPSKKARREIIRFARGRGE